ncbi:MAG: hypothetical protein M1358_11885, partial [Chloroflexi bacterium]|nr:hypothetical protein [Chloroflexota bacterium]
STDFADFPDSRSLRNDILLRTLRSYAYQGSVRLFGSGVAVLAASAVVVDDRGAVLARGVAVLADLVLLDGVGNRRSHGIVTTFTASAAYEGQENRTTNSDG